MNTLIVGGTSGLGLEIARLYSAQKNCVYVTGRRKFSEAGLNYERFDLSGAELSLRIEKLIDRLPKIHTMVYAAGYFQEGSVTDLSEQQIEEMISVSGRGLIYFVKALLNKQGALEELVTITSTSQWIPRKLEPIYNFSKAGAAHFSNAMAEDGRVAKVLVVGPAGMNTDFWKGVNRTDLDTMLTSAWVAKEIMKLHSDEFRYRFARIMRGPARVEIVETR